MPGLPQILVRGGLQIIALKKMIDIDAQFIEIDDKENTIKFKIQDGPVKEVGVNGCQIDDMISVAKMIVQALNHQCPCVENAKTIAYLSGAIVCLRRRRADREARGVEGTSRA